MRVAKDGARYAWFSLASLLELEDPPLGVLLGLVLILRSEVQAGELAHQFLRGRLVDLRRRLLFLLNRTGEKLIDLRDGLEPLTDLVHLLNLGRHGEECAERVL